MVAAHDPDGCETVQAGQDPETPGCPQSAECVLATSQATPGACMDSGLAPRAGGLRKQKRSTKLWPLTSYLQELGVVAKPMKTSRK